jgi:hypothetical protein
MITDWKIETHILIQIAMKTIPNPANLKQVISTHIIKIHPNIIIIAKIETASPKTQRDRHSL